MRLLKVFFVAAWCVLIIPTIAAAADFDWISNLNIQAQADPSGFRALLVTRFNIGPVQVDALLSNIEDPADAYVVLRLGEMSGKPMGQVIEKYRRNSGKGWGVLAKSLGIKPGSEEFQALKRGHDLGKENKRGSIRLSSYDHDHKNDAADDRGKGKAKNK